MKFLLITLVFLFSLQSETSQAQQFGSREALVLAQQVTFERERNRVEAVGTAEAVRSITIYPAVGDRVV
ncbi:MAG: efflux RND transporter periplasmic adaptor subunit, partial [Idiomarina loihiensis]